MRELPKYPDCLRLADSVAAAEGDHHDQGRMLHDVRNEYKGDQKYRVPVSSCPNFVRL